MQDSGDQSITVTCPNCRQLLSVERNLLHRSIPCPNCQRHFLLLLDSPDLLPERGQAWLVAAALSLLGSLTPVLMLAAMAVTLVLGPFAIAIGPLVGLVIAVVTCGYVHLRAGPRWFWFFVGFGLIFSILLQFWHGHQHLSVQSQQPSEPSAMLEQASSVARLFHQAVIVLWLVAATYVWLLKRPRRIRNEIG
jgi:hypothetical protein